MASTDYRIRDIRALLVVLIMSLIAVQGVDALTCNSCSNGQFYSDEANGCVLCPIGYYCPSQSEDPVPCPAGYFSTDPLIKSQSECKQCPSGTISPPGSSACSTCPPGTYANADKTSCASCPRGSSCNAGLATSCASGLWSLDGFDSCQTCPIGYYCPSKDALPLKCPPGTSSPAGSTECSSSSGKIYIGTGLSTTCRPGYYANGTICSWCPRGYSCPDGINLVSCSSGQFANMYGSESCYPCPKGFSCPSTSSTPSMCPLGSFSAAGASQCTICPDGSYCPSPMMVAPCPSGTYSSAGQTACTRCPDGFSCPTGGSPEICPAGTYRPSGSTSCQDCPAGFYCPASSSFMISACPQGTYSLGGAAMCTVCPPGFSCPNSQAAPVACQNGYYSLAGEMTCKPCPSGHVCPDKSSLLPCSAGQYSSGLTSPCTDCPIGTFCPRLGTSAPISCPLGSYSSSGSVFCTECPAGFMCPSPSSSQPTACNPGSFSPRGHATCTPCPAGSFCPTHATVDIIPCPKGTYSQGGAVSCQSCPGGSYCPLKATAPVACPLGYYSLPKSGECSICPAGTYCPAGATSPLLCSALTFSYSGQSNCTACSDGYACSSGDSSPIPLGEGCQPGGYCQSGVGYKPCPSGTFNPLPNGKNATDCKTCPAGLYCPLGTSDPLLQGFVCPPGYFCPAGSKTYQLTPCSNGTYNMFPMQRDKSSCLPCPAGSYCGLATVQPSSFVCPLGYYCPEGTSLAKEHPCPAGTFSNYRTGMKEVGECTSCYPGYYCPEASIYPVSCRAGTYNPVIGATSSSFCLTCPSGFTCPLSTGFHLQLCSPGHYCPMGTTPDTTVACPAGTYTDRFDALSIYDCLSCPEGFFCPQGTGGSSKPPVICPEGYFCPIGTSYSTQHPCPPGMYSNTTGLSSQDGCVYCPEGAYCTGGDNRISGVCPVGYYCPLGTQSEYQYPCPAGTFSSAEGVERVDECQSCPAGYFCLEASFAPIACSATTYSNQTSLASPFDCEPCPAGKYCGEATIEPVDCPPGTYSDTSQKECLKCLAGYYCSLPATSIDQMMSNKCPAGNYCPLGLGHTPSDYSNACPAGYYCPEATASPVACPSGTYNPSPGASSILECVACPAGYFCVGGKSQTSGVCSPGYFCVEGSSSSKQTPCPKGTFNPDSRSVSGSSCRNCLPGSYCDSGSPQPTTCPAGFYCPGGALEPLPCPFGTYSDAVGLKTSTDCTMCPNGSFCSSLGLTATSGLCSEGYFCPSGSTSSTQTICPAGFYCPLGTSDPIPCPISTIRSQKGGTQVSDCNKCPGGYYCESSGLTAPTGGCLSGYYCPDGSSRADQFPSPAGYYSTQNSSRPTPCPSGTYNPFSTRDSCLRCPKGQYCPVSASSLSTPCPPGSYCPVDSVFPVQCEEGTYNPLPRSVNADACLLCPKKNYCPNKGSSGVFGLCDAGYVCLLGAFESNPTDGITGYICPKGFYCPQGAETPVSCPIGTYSNVEGLGDTSDCTPCDSGFYCPYLNATLSELPCDEGFYCPLGQSISNPAEFICPAGYICPKGSATPTVCPEGFYVNKAGQSQKIICPPGYYCPKGTADPIACQQGFYCPEGSAYPVKCPAGTYQTSVNATNVLSCLSCPVGYYCESVGLTEPRGKCAAGYFCNGGAISPLGKTNSTSDPNYCPIGHYCTEGTTQPSPCPLGTFNPSLGATSIASCLPCLPGSYCSNTGLSKVSGLCNPGFYCLEGSTRSVPPSVNFGDICPPGYYCPLGTVNATSYPCPAGTYSQKNGSVGVQDCLPCPSKQFCNIGSSSPSGFCDAGFFCKLGSPSNKPSIFVSGMYGPCPDGMFCPAATEDPIPCVAGLYCNSSSVIGPCEAGYYCTGGAIDPRASLIAGTGGPCPEGSYCPEGSAKPTPCPKGTYSVSQQNIQASDCTPCPAGYVCPTTGVADPSQLCDAGYYCPEGSSIGNAQICPLGSYCPAGSGSPFDCLPGTFSNVTGLSICLACPAGMTCYQNGTITPDPCPTGFYCPSAGPGLPSLILPCPAGRYSNITGLESPDQCALCPQYTFCLEGSSSPTGPCSPGYHCKLGAATSQPTDGITGEICQPGSYCPSGSSPVACPEGTFNFNYGASSEDACELCPPGKYCAPSTGLVSSIQSCNDGYICTGGSSVPEPTDETGYTCPIGSSCRSGDVNSKQCNPGSYSSGVGQANCTSCDPGYACPTFGTSFPFVCPMGYFCPSGTSQPLPCPPGTFSFSTSLQTSFDCTPCPSGRFCSNFAQSTPSGLCEAGYICSSLSTSSKPLSDANGNGPCPSGHYCPQGTVAPLPCPVGTIMSFTGAKSKDQCEPCPAGYYCTTSGLSKPTGPCNAGFYCPFNFNSTTPSPPWLTCPAGSKCPAGSSNPIPCPQGQYQDTPKQSVCKDCPKGYYCPQQSSTYSLCPRGYYCEDGSADPLPCPAGTYGNSPGLSSALQCLPCPTGLFCNDGSLDSSKTCYAGYYCNLSSPTPTPAQGVGDSLNGPCPLNHYCDAGTKSPTPCPSYHTTIVPGASDTKMCVPCPAGLSCTSSGNSPCPAGFYCPEGEASVPCPAGTYSDQTGQYLVHSCVSCADGKWCPSGSAAQNPCPAGYFCPAGISSPIPCPGGTFSSLPGISSLDTCTGCLPGFYCPKGSSTQRPCPAGFYCPQRSTSPIPCLPGMLCPSKSVTQTSCPAGFYCPPTSLATYPCPDADSCPQPPATITNCPLNTVCHMAAKTTQLECPKANYCPAGSAYPVLCPLGYQANAGTKHQTMPSACSICPAGTFGADPNRIKCEPCDSGYICLAGATTARPNSPEERGYICPKGYYCMKAPGDTLTREYPCLPGTFSSALGANSSDTCQSCPRDSYNPLDGQANCFLCGPTSYPTEDSKSCECVGKHRVFQQSDSSCLCEAGYEYYNSLLEVENTDNTGDCQQVVYQACANGLTRAANGECFSDERKFCSQKCQSGSGTFISESGTCACSSQTSSQICDDACKASSNSFYLDTTSNTIIVQDANGAVKGTILLNTTTSFVNTATCNTGCSLQILAMNGNGFAGIYNSTSDYIMGLLDTTMSSRTSELSIGNDTEKSLPLGSFAHVNDPIVCLEQGSSLFFDLSVGGDHYPEYQVDSKLNTNPNFDYGAFRKLVTMYRSEVFDSKSFAFSFSEPGVYTFVDHADSSKELIVRVLPSGSNCGPNSMEPKSVQSLKSRSLVQNGSFPESKKWGVIGTLFGSAIALISTASVFFIKKVRPPTVEEQQKTQFQTVGDYSISLGEEHVHFQSKMAQDKKKSMQGESQELSGFNKKTFNDKLLDQSHIVAHKGNDTINESRKVFEALQQETEGLRNILGAKLDEIATRYQDSNKLSSIAEMIEGLPAEIERRKALAGGHAGLLEKVISNQKKELESFGNFEKLMRNYIGDVNASIDHILSVIHLSVSKKKFDVDLTNLLQGLSDSVKTLEMVENHEYVKHSTLVSNDFKYGAPLVSPLNHIEIDISDYTDEFGNLQDTPGTCHWNSTLSLYEPANDLLMRLADGRAISIPPGMCIHPKSGYVVPIEGNIGVESKTGKVVFLAGDQASHGEKVYPLLFLDTGHDGLVPLSTLWEKYATPNNIQSRYVDPYTGALVPTLAVIIDPMSKLRIPMGGSYVHPMVKLVKPITYGDVLGESDQGVSVITGVAYDNTTGRLLPLSGRIPESPDKHIIFGARARDLYSGHEHLVRGACRDSVDVGTVSCVFTDETTFYANMESNILDKCILSFRDILQNIADLSRELSNRDAVKVEETISLIQASHKTNDSENIQHLLRIQGIRRLTLESRLESLQTHLNVALDVRMTAGVLHVITLEGGQQMPVLLGENFYEGQSRLMCPILGVHVHSKTGEVFPLAGAMNDPVTSELIPITLGGRMKSSVSFSINYVSDVYFDEEINRLVPRCHEFYNLNELSTEGLLDEYSAYSRNQNQKISQIHVTLSHMTSLFAAKDNVTPRMTLSALNELSRIHKVMKQIKQSQTVSAPRLEAGLEVCLTNSALPFGQVRDALMGRKLIDEFSSFGQDLTDPIRKLTEIAALCYPSVTINEATLADILPTLDRSVEWPAESIPQISILVQEIVDKAEPHLASANEMQSEMQYYQQEVEKQLEVARADEEKKKTKTKKIEVVSVPEEIKDLIEALKISVGKRLEAIKSTDLSPVIEYVDEYEEVSVPSAFKVEGHEEIHQELESLSAAIAQDHEEQLKIFAKQMTDARERAVAQKALEYEEELNNPVHSAEEKEVLMEQRQAEIDKITAAYEKEHTTQEYLLKQRLEAQKKQKLTERFAELQRKKSFGRPATDKKESMMEDVQLQPEKAQKEPAFDVSSARERMKSAAKSVSKLVVNRVDAKSENSAYLEENNRKQLEKYEQELRAQLESFQATKMKELKLLQLKLEEKKAASVQTLTSDLVKENVKQVALDQIGDPTKLAKHMENKLKDLKLGTPDSNYQIKPEEILAKVEEDKTSFLKGYENDLERELKERMMIIRNDADRKIQKIKLKKEKELEVQLAQAGSEEQKQKLIAKNDQILKTLMDVFEKDKKQQEIRLQQQMRERLKKRKQLVEAIVLEDNVGGSDKPEVEKHANVLKKLDQLREQVEKEKEQEMEEFFKDQIERKKRLMEEAKKRFEELSKEMEEDAGLDDAVDELVKKKEDVEGANRQLELLKNKTKALAEMKEKLSEQVGAIDGRIQTAEQRKHELQEIARKKREERRLRRVQEQGDESEDDDEDDDENDGSHHSEAENEGDDDEASVHDESIALPSHVAKLSNSLEKPAGSSQKPSSHSRVEHSSQEVANQKTPQSKPATKETRTTEQAFSLSAAAQDGVDHHEETQEEYDSDEYEEVIEEVEEVIEEVVEDGVAVGSEGDSILAQQPGSKLKTKVSQTATAGKSSDQNASRDQDVDGDDEEDDDEDDDGSEQDISGDEANTKSSDTRTENISKESKSSKEQDSESKTSSTDSKEPSSQQTPDTSSKERARKDDSNDAVGDGTLDTQPANESGALAEDKGELEAKTKKKKGSSKTQKLKVSKSENTQNEQSVTLPNAQESTEDDNMVTEPSAPKTIKKVVKVRKVVYVKKKRPVDESAPKKKPHQNEGERKIRQAESRIEGATNEGQADGETETAANGEDGYDETQQDEQEVEQNVQAISNALTPGHEDGESAIQGKKTKSAHKRGTKGGTKKPSSKIDARLGLIIAPTTSEGMDDIPVQTRSKDNENSVPADSKVSLSKTEVRKELADLDDVFENDLVEAEAELKAALEERSRLELLEAEIRARKFMDHKLKREQEIDLLKRDIDKEEEEEVEALRKQLNEREELLKAQRKQWMKEELSRLQDLPEEERARMVQQLMSEMGQFTDSLADEKKRQEDLLRERLEMKRAHRLKLAREKIDAQEKIEEEQVRKVEEAERAEQSRLLEEVIGVTIAPEENTVDLIEITRDEYAYALESMKQKHEDEKMELKKKLEQEIEQEESEMLRILRERKEKIMTKAINEAEKSNKDEAKDMLEIYESQLKNIEESCEQERKKQMDSLHQRLLDKKKRKEEELAQKQTLELLKKEEEGDRKKANIAIERQRGHEKILIEGALQKLSEDKVSQAIELVMQSRHGAELKRISEQQQNERDYAVKEAVYVVQQKFSEIFSQMHSNHMAAIKFVFSDPDLDYSQMEAIRSDVVASQERERSAMESRFYAEVKEAEATVLRELDKKQAQERIALREQQLRELVDITRAYLPNMQEPMETEILADELGKLRERFENSKLEKIRQIEENRRKQQEEEAQRLQNDLQQFEQQLDVKTAMGQKLIENAMKRQAEEGTTEVSNKDEILQRHNAELAALQDAQLTEKERQQRDIQARLAERKKSKMKKNQKEQPTTDDLDKQETIQLGRIAAETDKIMADRRNKLADSLRGQNKPAAVPEEQPTQGSTEPVSTLAASTVSAPAPTKPVLELTPEQLEISLLAAITRRIAEIEKEMAASGLILSMPAATSQSAALPKRRPKGSSAQKSVSVTDLRPSQYIVYKFGLRVVDLLCINLGHDRVSVLAATNISPGNYEDNAYDGKLYFDQDAKTLFIKVECFSDPGYYVMLLVHSMAHINIENMSDDQNPQFIREFYRCLRVCFDDMISSSLKSDASTRQHGCENAQSFLDTYSQLPSLKDREAFVSGFINFENPNTAKSADHFTRDKLRARMTKYQAFHFQHTFLKSFDESAATEAEEANARLQSLLISVSNKRAGISVSLEKAEKVKQPSRKETLESDIRSLEDKIDRISEEFTALSKQKNQLQLSLIKQNKELNALTKTLREMSPSSPEYAHQQELVSQKTDAAHSLQDKKDAVTVEANRLSLRMEKFKEEITKKQSELDSLAASSASALD